MAARRFCLPLLVLLIAPMLATLFAPMFVSTLCAPARADEPPPANEPDANVAATPASYQATVRAAIAAQATGDFDGAHALFKQANGLEPNARTLRGMGVASFQAMRFARALRELDAALVHPEKPLDAELRRAVEDLRVRASAEVGVWILRVEPPEARIAIDDGEPAPSQRPLVLDPGLHQLALTAEGFVEQRIEISVMPGTRGPMAVRLAKVDAGRDPNDQPPVPAVLTELPEAASGPVLRRPVARAHRRRLIASWTMLSVAGAAGLTSGAFWVTGVVRINEIAKECRKQPGGKCTIAQREREWRAANISDLERNTTIGVSVAGAALVAAGTVLGWDYFANGGRFDLRLSASSVSVQTRF